MRLLVLVGATSIVALACDDTNTSADVEPEDRSQCAQNFVTIDEINQANPLEAGALECVEDSDCTLRSIGDYCSCPYVVPQAITKARALAFDVKAKSVACTCPYPGCDGGLVPTAVACIKNRCAVGVCTGSDPDGLCRRDGGADAAADGR